MKYLLIFAIIFIIGCKKKSSKVPEVQKVEIETIPEVQKIETKNKKDSLIVQRDFYEDINIAVCNESKLDSVLYQRFVKMEEATIVDRLSGKLFQRGEDEEVNRLFQIEQLDCMVSLSGGRYHIFDLYYIGIPAENIYADIIDINKNWMLNNDLDFFFKRGMVFILNKKQNKLTVLVYNPFAYNDMPDELEGYFKQHTDEFDRVFGTTGIGTTNVFVE